MKPEKINNGDMNREYQIRQKLNSRKVKTLDDKESIVDFFSNSDRPVGAYFAWVVHPFSGRIISEINSRELKELVRGSNLRAG